MSDYRLYILMRNDLPSLNPGKAMAQAAHAANQFIHYYGKDKNVKEWQKDGDGFGTTIVLSVNIFQLNVAMNKSRENDAGKVIDPTYPFIVDKEVAKLIPDGIQTAPAFFLEGDKVVLFRSEITCAYIFGEADSLKDVLGNFPLHP